MARIAYSTEQVAAVVATAKAEGAPAAAKKHNVSYQTVRKWMNAGLGSGAKVVKRRPATATAAANGQADPLTAYTAARDTFNAARAALVAHLGQPV